MLFFSVEVRFKIPIVDNELIESTQAASFACKRFYERSEDPSFIFVETIMDKRLMCIAMVSNERLKSQTINETVCAFLSLLCIESDIIETNEITCSAATEKLRTAVGRGYVVDSDAILDELGIRWIGKGSMVEKIVPSVANKDAVLKKVAMFSDMPCLVEEIERIYQQCSAAAYSGHPVHYIVEMDCQDLHIQVAELLLSALQANKRIRSKRFVIKEYASVEPISETYIQNMFESCEGGTCVIDYISGDRGHEDSGQPEEEDLDKVCVAMNNFKHSVLTVICVSPIQKAVRDGILKRLPSFVFVQIAKESFYKEGAAAYLHSLAEDMKVQPNDSLMNLIKTDHEKFTMSELQEHFDEWYDSYLRRIAYPQYAVLSKVSVPSSVKQAITKSGAYEQLQSMIGLREAKKIIDQLLNYCKAQKLFMSKGVAMENLPMHMVFTGNPGTAKTTVARLFAQIMKDNGILPIGNLLEVGRADLVGKYVGWTARLVKEKFKEARGSVLFIDEAYSLVDDMDGMYGDEAINAIVQEMENQRDNVVVIFAGYPGKMDRFLKKNPGMRSRIGYWVHFPDYSADELFEILAAIAEDSHMKLASDVRDKMMPVFYNAKTEEDYGNGRFVRNAFKKARLYQANRLLQQNFDAVTKKDMMTVCADDFENISGFQIAQPKRIIGFSL